MSTSSLLSSTAVATPVVTSTPATPVAAEQISTLRKVVNFVANVGFYVTILPAVLYGAYKGIMYFVEKHNTQVLNNEINKAKAELEAEEAELVPYLERVTKARELVEESVTERIELDTQVQEAAQFRKMAYTAGSLVLAAVVVLGAYQYGDVIKAAAMPALDSTLNWASRTLTTENLNNAINSFKGYKA